MSNDKNEFKSGKGRRTVGIVIVSILVIFAIGLLFTLPGIITKFEENKENEIRSNMESIYTSAIIVDEIDVGLHEDSDGAGKYEKLSEMSGFRVYNSPQKDRYSVVKDYRTGKITVRYGEKLQYPEVHEQKEVEIDNVDDVATQDLFNYDESGGRVVIIGFSEVGVSLLTSESVIQIPTTYNGRDVVEIADRAFYNRSIMGTVIIPENIKKIGDGAFSNNGVKGVSDNIPKPYVGSWKVDDKTWVKVGE